MIDYIYDGTFDGLLTCVYNHYYIDRAGGIYTGDSYQPNMLWGSMTVETDEAKAAKVYDAIEEKISAYDLRGVYKAYLSSVPGKEMIILRYLVMGFRKGPAISSLHGDPVVKDFQAILKKISVEAERMLQFVRFSVMDGNILYADIEPDHDVLELLHTHFCDRFRNDPFIIHDVGRGKAMIAYQKHWYITDFDEDSVPRLSQEELSYRDLWKTFFDNIAIKERANYRCQRNFMPERYRRHLTEITHPAQDRVL
ncbi:MAG: TIGR03915 family putative DNA repair protein [Bacillota bacterium]|nr:TIGR03915 family putative DNA repair protein [Bacillota bacterium]